MAGTHRGITADGDHTPLFRHRLNRRLNGKEDTTHVDGQGGIQIVQRIGLKGTETQHARIYHRDIQPAVVP